MANIPTIQVPTSRTDAEPRKATEPVVARILHAADLQLGAIQYGLPARQRDFDNTCRLILAEARVRRVDAVVLAGDIFEMPRPPSSSVRALAEGVAGCAEDGIVVYGIEGNHDVTPNSDWLRTCGVIPLNEDACKMAPIDNVPIIGGLNYTPPHQFMARLTEYLAAHPTVSVLVIHQTLAELCGFTGSPLTVLDVAALLGPTKVRTVLLGDIHNYAEMDMGGIKFCQPGSPEITSSSDSWPRSANLLGLSKDGVVVESQQIILPVRPFKFLRVLSEEDVLSLAADTKATHDGMQPLYYIKYSPTLPDIRKRIESMMPPGSLSVINPTSLGGVAIDDDPTLASLEKFERQGAKAALSNMLTQPPFNFAPDTETYQLITALMDTPDELAGVLGKYCRAHGVVPAGGQ